ncbi:MAG: hypothetical protein IKG65_10380 [Exiguobacterium sp.]|nr:hypothetical protein [Exiguobacterium sp.]MBR2758167.1 hypothetical protein [Exiguobacterium sp.]MBR3062795.1 hypothetical protein [Exiguobacterium sp.]MBR3214865.1 hypothetical protein [Exiguobacterium sp.]MBR3321509.1 hypothetical protein [Exiguobacterium sp.]
MVDHEVRLERMLKEDKKRKKQLTLPLVGAIVLTFFYIWTTNVFLLYAMIFFGQFPALYKSWHRKKLLLSFNEDKRYQQLVRSEFLLGLTSPLLVLILITSAELEWISLFTFVIIALIGIMVLLILSFPIDRKLKEIDPLHVTGVELGHVQLQRKKRKGEA